MPQPQLTHFTQSLVIIPLKKTPLKKIVKKKLDHFLENEVTPKDIFPSFYSPVEKAVIECALSLFRGNQSRVADYLEMNRNTLKKKIDRYQVNIKQWLSPSSSHPYFKREIYLGHIAQLDLLQVSRFKLEWLKKDSQVYQYNLLEKVCAPVEQVILQTTLQFFNSNYLKTSTFLDINRNTLKKKLQNYTFSQESPSL